MGLLLGAALSFGFLAISGLLFKVYDLEEKQKDHRVDARESFEHLEERIETFTKRLDSQSEWINDVNRAVCGNANEIDELTKLVHTLAKKPQPKARKRTYRSRKVA